MPQTLNPTSFVPATVSLPQWHKCSPTPQEGSWVYLLEKPTVWSADEALLLCQESEYEWVVWIPDYGEATIHLCQFCDLV